jgi:hypothetical protein
MGLPRSFPFARLESASGVQSMSIRAPSP